MWTHTFKSLTFWWTVWSICFIYVFAFVEVLYIMFATCLGCCKVCLYYVVKDYFLKAEVCFLSVNASRIKKSKYHVQNQGGGDIKKTEILSNIIII